MISSYYIDGYNVIYHSSVLKPLALENFEIARDALIEKVARFCVATGHHAKIIFDGRGRRSQPFVPIAGAPGLEVVYSTGKQSADAFIERTVYAASNPRTIVVVSGDRGIRDLCRNLNALVIEPDNFLASIRETDGDTRATIQRTQRNDTLQRIENRLDDNAIGLLLKHKQELEEK